MRRPLYGIVVLLLVLAVAPGLRAQGADADSVLKAREAALAARDFDAILGLFADDAVVVTSSGRLLIGKEQVRTWVQDQVDRRQREEAGPRQAQGSKLSWAGKVHRDDWQKLGVSPPGCHTRRHRSRRQGQALQHHVQPESGTSLEAARKKAR